MEHCRKAVEQLVGGKQEQIVLFGGTSAGGRGSMVEFIINIINIISIIIISS